MGNPGQASQTSLAMAAAAIIGARWASAGSSEGGHRSATATETSEPAADYDEPPAAWSAEPAAEPPAALFSPWGPPEAPATDPVAATPVPEDSREPADHEMVTHVPGGAMAGVATMFAPVSPAQPPDLFSHPIPSPRTGYVEPPAEPEPALSEPEPAYTPPTYTPPAHTPPAYTPPAYTPPAPTPPAYTPPADGYGLGSVMGDTPFPAPFDAGSLEPAPFFGPEYERQSPAADPDDPLPRRIPTIPYIPEGSFLLDPSDADGLELDRIATYLRDDADAAAVDTDFDIDAVLEAVRAIENVRDARLLWNETTGHTLRVEFVDGVDEVQITREVARVLREKMGLPTGHGRDEATQHVPPRARVSATARVPGRAVPGATLSTPARPGPLPRPPRDATRLAVEHVQVTMVGVEAMVEVRLVHGRAVTTGTAQGPAVDAYLLRLAAGAAGDAIDKLTESRARIYIEHVGLQQFAGVEVAVVVVLLTHGASTEQLSGSAIVAGDPRQAAVRATLQAVNRRLESLLA